MMIITHIIAGLAGAIVAVIAVFIWLVSGAQPGEF